MQKKHTDKEEIQIDKKRLIDQLIDLCRIVGPSGRESRIAEYIIDFARNHISQGLILDPFSVETIPDGGDTANIIIRVPGTAEGEIIFLSAHLDTVPVNFDGEPEIVLSEGILTTQGDYILGADDRAGVAAALEMISLGLLYPHRHAGFEVLFTVQEELGCRGTREMDKSLIKAEYGYNLDGETAPGSIIIRAPRKAKYTCEIYGISSHAALAPDKGLNAISIAGRIITNLPQGQINPDTTANIGSVLGGGQTNIVPDYVKLTGEIRSFTEQGFIKISNDIEQICKTLEAGSEGRTDLSWEHAYNGYSINTSSKCISRFSEACRRAGVKPEFLSSPGGGDSNNLNALGIDNVVFGLGMHKIHTSHEYLVVDEFLSAVEILKEVVFSSIH
jgi:tripeptide aminopeptidase